MFISHTHTVNTPIQLHVEVSGPADGRMIVLLHGFPEFFYGWKHQIGPLARSGFFVAAPDQRGYNLSAKPASVASYEVDVLAQDVIAILDQYRREKAVIVGHDWGGVVAWQLGISYPERVEKLVILNAPHPAAMTRALMNPATGQLARSWYVYAFQIPGWAEFIIRLTRYRALARAMQATAHASTFTQEDMRRYREAWSRPGALTGMINWYRAIVRRTLRMGQKEYQRAAQVRVTPPTLILWGERDTALSPSLAQSSLEWCEQGSLVRFPNATHWLQHDEPERVTNRILDFAL